jgi:subtilase family serine protease
MFSLPMQGQAASQPAAVRPLITQTVDQSQLTTLKGNTHPLARPQFDLGTAPASLPMQRMLLVLKRAPEQETALRKLLDDQQDKSSPSYHQWLTPEQYGQQFGPTDTDLQTITVWLQSHGFQVGSTKGRTVLEFSGTAGQVQEAFHTMMHKYIVNGEQHWANASDPQIPTALTGAVAGVLTLHNFIKKPAIHFSGQPIPAKVVRGKKPQVTFPGQNGQPSINALAPQDYAVIYNINPVYAGAVYGSPAIIGVIGRSNLYNSGQDVQNFFAEVGYGDNSFGGTTMGVVLNGPDPGDLGGGEEAEATLDSTWPGAIAPTAQVALVVSATTNTADGIDLSEIYIIENNFADVMTESFSACELYATDSQLAGASAMAEQAAAQGITYFVSTGDDGAEGCDDPNVAPATNPISVNYLASTAFNVAVGGTMFNEGGNPSKYWTSTTPISETALSYIPEDTWNESSVTNGLWSSSGGASSGNIVGGFGGTTAGVPKPNWQYGVEGIPQDGVRDLPDVSLTAASHDPYLLCLEGSCEPNSQGEIFVYFVNGTSASAPSFAGVMALVEAGLGATTGTFARQGLANYPFYRLAATPSAYPSQCNGSNSPASSCIFNDVTAGNNVVPGEVGTEYSASAGYDLTTGLGSVNVANLVNNWGTVSFNPTTTTLTFTSSSSTHGSPVPFGVSVTPKSGTGMPTGDVSLLIYASDIGGLVTGAVGPWALSGGSLSTSTTALPGGAYPVSARYAGDGTYAPSISPQSSYTLVYPEPSTTTVSVLTVSQSGAAIPFTSGPFGSFVYLRADIAGQSGQGAPSGKVTFSDSFGPIPGLPYPLSLNSQGNTATPNGIFAFDTGTHTISASYSGDQSFNASNTTQSQTFTITTDFMGRFLQHCRRS